METKICNKCGEEKPLGMFNKNNQRKDGLTASCKACLALIRKDWDKKYNQSEKCKAAARRYRESGKGRATKRAYRETYVITPEQQERYREAARQHRNDPKYRVRTERYYQSPKGKRMKARKDRRYRLTPKGRFSIRKIEIKRKHQIMTTECTLTKAEWDAIKERFHYRCAYCGKQLQRPEMDHVIPLSKGGPHTAANVVPACRTCNAKKSNKLLQPGDQFGL